MVEVERRIDTATKQAIRQRNYRRVRDRALTRLSALHKEEYLTLLEEERAKDEAQGKVWLDISGRTNAHMDKAKSNRNTGNAKGFSNQTEARNLG
jgi:hypothetical protein